MRNEALWIEYINNNNNNFYGRNCINVAHQVMQLLDEDSTPLHSGYAPNVNTLHGLICKADDIVNAGGISGYQAKIIIEILILCHERGEEIAQIYNKDGRKF